MSEPNVFLLPDLGEGLTEAELVNWLVAVGDEIRVDQPIAEVETAKSLVEVPSPYAGTVAILHGEPGQTLDVGKPLISVLPAGAVADAPAVAETSDETAKEAVAPSSEAAADTYREEEKAGSGNVLIGYGTSGGHGQTRRTRARRGGNAPAKPAPATEPATPELRPAVSSPLVRRIAREGGVELGSLKGTGAAGLIMRRDVEAALTGQRSATAPAPLTTQPGSPALGEPAPSYADIDSRTGLGIAVRTPVKGVRKVVAANMSRSRSEIPEATVWVDVDATALVEMRADLKKRNPDHTPGLLAFIARFVTSGLKRYPELNTRYQDAADGETKEIVGFDGINLGFAAQTDRGLVVPSIRNAEKLSARELDAEIRRLSKLARDGKATPAELGGGTFTLNNYGVFGVDGSAAIINYPEVAILGVGRIIDRPWVVDGELAVRKVVELTLVFDHRVCDGGTAGGFLRHVADAIENPASALADL